MKTSFRLLLSAAIGLAVSLASVSYLRAQTIYNQPANPLAQILGGSGASAATPTFAATVALPIATNAVVQINGVSTTSATSTLTAGVAPFGKILVVFCKADSSGTVTYTFGTGFKPTGTAAPTAGTTIVVLFVSDGTNFFEMGRSSSAITG